MANPLRLLREVMAVAEFMGNVGLNTLYGEVSSTFVTETVVHIVTTKISPYTLP